MIRAVLDTNVYVAALLSRQGAPARLVAALHEGLFDALTCPKQLAELAGVLARPKIARHVSADTARDFVAWLERVAVTVPDPCDVAALSPDPDDDYLIALAHSGRARVIVSGDAHLLQIEDATPPVIPPAEFALLVEGLR